MCACCDHSAVRELHYEVEPFLCCSLQLSSRPWISPRAKRTVRLQAARSTSSSNSHSSNNTPSGRRTGTIKPLYRRPLPLPLPRPSPPLRSSSSLLSHPPLPPSQPLNSPLRPPPPPVPRWMGRQPKWTPACPWRSRGEVGGEERRPDTYLFPLISDGMQLNIFTNIIKYTSERRKGFLNIFNYYYLILLIVGEVTGHYRK